MKILVSGAFSPKFEEKFRVFGDCLIGMGNIAVEVAKRAKSFGMKVLAYRQSGEKSDFAEVKPTE